MRDPEGRIHLGREIVVAANHFKRATDRIIEKRAGLTAAQANTLHYIMDCSRTGAVYQKNIEQTFGLRSPSVTGMLKQLEAKGLVRRETDEQDARLKRIVPTEEAWGIQEQIRGCIFEMEDVISDCLSDEERQSLLAVLEKIAEAISRKEIS